MANANNAESNSNEEFEDYSSVSGNLTSAANSSNNMTRNSSSLPHHLTSHNSKQRLAGAVYPLQSMKVTYIQSVVTLLVKSLRITFLEAIIHYKM